MILPPLTIKSSEIVIAASIEYFVDTGMWPDNTSSCDLCGNETCCFYDYYEGILRASYSFDPNGFIDGVGDPGGVGGGMTSSMYDGIHWENPAPPTVGHGQWVVSD